MVDVNEKIQEYLRTGQANGWQSAVEQEKGITYVRYDAIRIGAMSDSTGGMAVQFMWDACQVAWARFPDACLEGVRFHQTKVSGRVRISGV